MSRWRNALGALACVLGLSACRSYSERLEPVRYAVAAGDPQAGLDRIDSMLKLDKPTALPDKWGKEVPLMILERATLQQAVGEYEASIVNFGAAEQELEFLDLARDAPGKISEYLLSASAKKYKTTPIEKLFLNSLNLLNYLALGDLEGARVEARRWRVMRDYLRDELQDGARGSSLTFGSAFGAFLAGYTFEKSGKAATALRYYAEALELVDLPFLAPYLAQLGQQNAYRTPQLEAMIKAGQTSSLDPEKGELLVVAQVGQVPYRQAKRVPVGLAVGLAAEFFVPTPGLLERSAAKFVNYPELVVESPGPRAAGLIVDGQGVSLPLVANAALAVQDEFDRLRPRIVAAALTRTLSRAAVAYGVEKGTQAAQGDDSSAGLLGFLLGTAVEASLVAADQPDTRSWSVLPGYFFVTRIQVAPGRHRIALRLSPTQTTYEQVVQVSAGASQLLMFSAYVE